MKLLSISKDLGIKSLATEWGQMARLRHLREDVVAGITVACIAIPLSLAIALASGVPPAIGLFTAIVGGIVCALFGGTPLAVSGPAAAMAVLVASVVDGYGLAGLLVVGLLCGVFQLATGVLGLGRIVRLVPAPVVEGFTAGIGAIILIGQLPRVLGVEPPQHPHILGILTHAQDWILAAQPASLLIATATIALVLGLPKVNPKLPAALLAIAIPTVLVAVLGISTAEIGSIPNSLPSPSIPKMPEGVAWTGLLGTAFTVYAIASLETLLSSSAVDKLARGRRHDPNQELIGQGLGNVASALIGGIPVTGVIARSALNVQAGAKTRRSALIHSFVLIASVFLFAPWMARIPIAALAGVLVSVALRMLDPRKLAAMWRVSRPDAAVSAATFVAIVGLDLINGIQWGSAAALLMAVIRLGRTDIQYYPKGEDGSVRLELSGPVTFVSSLKIERLQNRLEQLNPDAKVALDLTGVTMMDATGAEMVVDLIGMMKAKGMAIAVCGANPDIVGRLTVVDHAEVVASTLARTPQEAAHILARRPTLSPRQRLVVGVEHYHLHHLPRYKELFERLADRQTPHTLLITCCDSRIQPSVLTSADPGELFIVRNIGNMVPLYSANDPPAAGAAIEYALGVLGVSEIVVCGHSRCGAIAALRSPKEVPSKLRTLHAWLGDVEARGVCASLPKDFPPDEVARVNVLLQLDHLRTYPVVSERLRNGTARIHGWFFDIGTGQIEEWDPTSQEWVPLGVDHRPEPATDLPMPSETRLEPAISLSNGN